MTKKAYNNLKLVQEHYSEELRIEFSLAKLVEHLAANKVKDFYHKDSQCIRENKEIN